MLYKDTYEKLINDNVSLFKKTYAALADDSGNPTKLLHSSMTVRENNLALALLSVISEAVAHEKVERIQALGDLDYKVIDDIYRRLDALEKS